MTEPKMYSVRVNGELIGSFPDTGNRDKNLAASKELVARLGLEPKGKAQALTAFGQARSFAKAAQLLRTHGFREHPWDPNLIAPLIVNTAFAIEVYLKAIGELTIGRMRGHELAPLFDQLPPEVQNAIQSAYDEHAAEHKQTPAPVRNHLDKMNSAFVEWRYLYENASRLQFEITVAFATMHALDHVGFELGSKKS